MAKRRSNGQGTLFKRNGRGPWIARWYDHRGERLERSTRTTDHAAAARILGERVAAAALRREGVIDAAQDRFASEGRKPLAEHVADYIGHCRHTGQADRHVDQKATHLERLQDVTEASRLADLTADALERYMRHLRDDGLSARTANFARQIAIAFTSWCLKTGRLPANPLKVVPKLDERRDRRRVRRPLTDNELARLLDVAERRGRKTWYMAAALAGLRKGDLQRMRWCDLDFSERTLTIRDGKAKREDVIPMHPQLADELRQRQAESLATPRAKVFPQTVTDVTRQKDFLRAGLAHEQVVTDDAGQPVMVGEGKRRHAKTRIVCEDAEGRVIDLHAMRTTLGTNLARAGVAPQVAQRIMRHSDYRTTQKHYTVLGLNDTTAAIDTLPDIQRPQDGSQQATGTDDADPSPNGGDGDPHLNPRQLGRVRAQTSAEGLREAAPRLAMSADHKSSDGPAVRAAAQPGAILCDHPAGVAQLVERQLPKLNVEGSSPFTRFPDRRDRGRHKASGLDFSTVGPLAVPRTRQGG